MLKTLLALLLALCLTLAAVSPAMADDPAPGAPPPPECVAAGGACPDDLPSLCQSPQECGVADQCTDLSICGDPVYAPAQCDNPMDCNVQSEPPDSCQALGTCTDEEAGFHPSKAEAIQIQPVSLMPHMHWV